tara:strand:+ start:399 stop:797 length:399 start_codon:yes stop_codon:yes gene_type:complete
MNAKDPESIDLDKLSTGPIRNKSLTPELLVHIQAVYDVVGPYLTTTLEQFEIAFMRDSDPESEVAIWTSIAAAWISYHEQYLNDEYLPDDDEKELIAALIAISAGVDDEEALGLPAGVGQKLLACYDSLGEE